jgi:hypothetical protein
MSAMKWAEQELRHIGRIAAVEDSDIQYSYAMSTLYGMLHLKKALTELTNDSAYSVHREDLQRTLDQVLRAIKHLIKDYSLDLNAIQTFNTKKILGDLADVRPVNVRPANVVPNVRPVNVATPVRPVNVRVPRANNTRKNGNKPQNASKRVNTKPNQGFFGFLGF